MATAKAKKRTRRPRPQKKGTTTSTSLDRREAFAREYILDSNATQAAIRAGYSPKTARSQGTRLLTYAAVVKRIEELQAERFERLEITADRILEEIARIAFSDISDFVEWTDTTVRLRPSAKLKKGASLVISQIEQTRTRNGGSLKIKLHDKLGALLELVKIKKLRNGSDDPEEAAASIRAALESLDRATRVEPTKGEDDE